MLRPPAGPVAAAMLVLAFLASPAEADRRYFTQSYTPYLAPAGNLELEVTSVGSSG